MSLRSRVNLSPRTSQLMAVAVRCVPPTKLRTRFKKKLQQQQETKRLIDLPQDGRSNRQQEEDPTNEPPAKPIEVRSAADNKHQQESKASSRDRV